LLLAIVFACSAIAWRPTFRRQDVYISLGTGNEMVFNQTEILLCGINVTEVNKTRVSNYPEFR